MILGFKPRFIVKRNGKYQLIEGKIHTIRADKHNKWHPGRIINFAIGTRTANYFQFETGVCTDTQRITFWNDNGSLGVRIGYHELSHSEKIHVAINDGFESYEDMFKWFMPYVIKFDLQEYNAKIIHWTNFTYDYSSK